MYLSLNTVKGFFRERMWEKNYKTFFSFGLFSTCGSHQPSDDDLFQTIYSFVFVSMIIITAYKTTKKISSFFFLPIFLVHFLVNTVVFKSQKRLSISLARCRLSLLYSSIPNSLMCVYSSWGTTVVSQTIAKSPGTRQFICAPWRNLCLPFFRLEVKRYSLS